MSSRAILNAFKHLIESPTERVIAKSILSEYSLVIALNSIRSLAGIRKFHCSGEACEVSSAPEGKHGLTVGEATTTWIRTFQEQEVLEPEESIRNIIASVLNMKELSEVDRSKQQCLTAEQTKMLETLCKKRIDKMPFQYIVGEWEFRGMNLKMRPPVFIPRPETETFVDLVIEELHSNKAKRVLELCSGSGVISVAMLKEFPDITVTAVDRSADACALTKENAQRLGVEKRLSMHQYEMTGEDNMEFLGDKFDFVVANAPYNPWAAIKKLPIETTIYEDVRALNGGNDGLDVIKYVLKLTPNVLRNGCKLFLEVFPSHPEPLQEILARKTYPSLFYSKTFKDPFGTERYVEIIKNE